MRNFINMNIFAWDNPPSLNQICQFIKNHDNKSMDLLIHLPNHNLPNWQSDHDFSNESKSFLLHRLQHALSLVQFESANYIELSEQIRLWLMPSSAITQLKHYFPNQNIHWQTPAIEQNPLPIAKPWLIAPIATFPKQVLIIGAGIAGAATAYELARRGVKVQVLEAANQVATAASGNHQGLLYAKISPHHTVQTELLLCGYRYTRYLLETLLPNENGWRSTGILHINHNINEQKRNLALAQQHWHSHLYRYVNAQQASQLAGINIHQDGLFWQYGACIHPPTLVNALLEHKNIQVFTKSPILETYHDGKDWHAHTPHGTFYGSHIVFCTGAHYLDTPIVKQFPFQVIRGQTNIAHCTHTSALLKIALSGSSYLTPAWQQYHCYGASFIPHDNGHDWRNSDSQHNLQELQKLHFDLATELSITTQPGHAAVRCDCHDHLPAVGALGDVEALRQAYAKLAVDKNYHLDHISCPYYPNAYVNTAHGSRGLCTAPICAADIAAHICTTPPLLSTRVQQALHPNRLIIRKIIYKQ